VQFNRYSITEAIPEMSDEHSSKAGTEPGKKVVVRHDRSKSGEQFSKVGSAQNSQMQFKSARNENSPETNPAVNEHIESESDFSIDSLSDRSDLDPTEVEALVRRYYERRQISWSTLSFTEKLKLFKIWYLVAMCGNLCTIFGSIMLLLSNTFVLGYSEVFLGFGAFCTWSSITKYLNNTKNFSIIMRTFHEAIPLIMKVWVGILPFYIGVTFLTITVMYEFQESFGGATQGFFTIFALQGGDALYDTYTAMRYCNFFYANLFMYGFLFFLIALVQNIFMVIVEDSYVSIKYAKNFEWLNSKGNKGGENHNGNEGG